MTRQLIGGALAVAFLVLISIIAGVGYLGLSAMENLHADELSISQTEWQDVELADQALAYHNQNAYINMEMVMVDDPREIASLLTQRTANSAHISAVIEALRARIGSDKERELLDAVVQNRGTYVASYQHATDLFLKGHNREAARRWLIQQTFLLQVKYDHAWSEFSSFQAEEMTERLERSAQLYSASRQKTLYLLIAGVALALAIASFTVRRIVVEISRREGAENDIRQLNEQLETKVQHRTAALEASHRNLTIQIAERQAAEEQLRRKNAFLEAQANSTVDGILVVDGEGRKILQNRRFKEIFQLPKQVAEDDMDHAALDYVMSRTVNPAAFMQKVEYLYHHRDEVSRDEIDFRDGMVLDRYSAPVVGDDERYYGRIWVFRDISERKRNEEVVRRLSTAVEQSPVLVIITDLRGNIVYVNRKFVDCTGYSFDEVIGKNPRLLKSGYTSGAEYKGLWATIMAGNEWRGEFQNRKKNGELYWEYAVITPIRDEKGTVSHFLALKEDITARRAMEAELQRAQKLEAIGQLAAGVAHEINTPMQFIGDNTRFVQEAWKELTELVSLICSLRDGKIKTCEFQQRLDDFDCDELKYLQRETPAAIEQSLDGVGRVSKIVHAMKEFSHPGSEEKQPTDINHAIETTLTVARNEWKYVADVETHFSEDIGLVPCHRGEFNQVILNLLVNAAHAIEEVVGDGLGKKGKITIRTQRNQDWIEISIQDSGCGIPEAVQPHIFEPFFTTKEVGKGTGQGLTVAHAAIVKKHCGKIWFESEVGKGTTFFIRLPAHPG